LTATDDVGEGNMDEVTAAAAREEEAGPAEYEEPLPFNLEEFNLLLTTWQEWSRRPDG
jgi:hypothetical protein